MTKAEQLRHFLEEWEKYLGHIEQTGRKMRSAEAGWMDSSPTSKSASSLIGENVRVGFGKDVSRDFVFNEEQASQLGKLREEARRGGGLFSNK